MAKGELVSISADALAHVTGGLITPPQGPDPQVLKDVQDLAGAVTSAAQSVQQGQAAKQQMLSQVMQGAAQKKQHGAA